MNKLKNFLRLAVSFSVMVFRDMLIGLIIGVCAAVIMYKMNPATLKVVGLLMPAGVFAGIFKGIAKYIFLNLNSDIPSTGYYYNYPKFKILGLWIIVLVLTFLICYSINLSFWLYEPTTLIQHNLLIGEHSVFWQSFLVMALILGILSYCYNPPYNKAEKLKPETSFENE